jgi:hypothetical protein
MPTLKMPNLPTMKMPTMPTMPTIDLSKLELPKFAMPHLPTTRWEIPRVEQDLVGIARDAAYASIGLSVLAVQQAQRGAAAITGQLRRYAK